MTPIAGPLRLAKQAPITQVPTQVLAVGNDRRIEQHAARKALYPAFNAHIRYRAVTATRTALQISRQTMRLLQLTD